MMSIYEVDPLLDPRWPELLQRDHRASVFHTPGWLEALRRTYGYSPVVLTTSAPQEPLANGILFCRVNSWLTGRRMVSLPFSDHCEPLLNDGDELAEVGSFLLETAEKTRLKYIEIRPLSSPTQAPLGMSESAKFYFHKINLSPSIDELFRSFHKKTIRQGIQHAERAGLTYERGNCQTLLNKFYRLFVMTRRRHGLPPPPLQWFKNLLACLGQAVQIRIASQDGQPVAADFDLAFKNSLVCKYGGSDTRFNKSGGGQFVFWRTIQEAKSEGVQEVDLGRSDPDNEGLITFKDRCGANRSMLSYWRLATSSAQTLANNPNLKIAKRVFGYAPDPMRIQLGKLLYKHIG